MAYTFGMAKRNEGDPLQGKSFRLHKSQIEFVQALTERGIFPGNESDVFRHLLQRAIDDLTATEYVQKKIAEKEALKPSKKT